MPADRDSTPLIEWVAIAISPVLIMLMVGSLVFFLIEVLYGGQYQGRLLYTMFFFVFGAVLIARIAINFGYARASLYGLGLGGAVFVAMLAFVKYPNPTLQAVGPVLNLGLIALVWWSANKLTWDCTHLDEDRTASGRGLLVAAGLDGVTAPADGRRELAADEPDDAKKKKKRKESPGLLGWFDRFARHRDEQRKKPHTPGVWVVYFSLAALPLFGLGQSLIDPADGDRRRATFLQMAVYVGSGLGLLVTTSLLGLKKYLQDRNARIPPAMTAGWLGLGAGLIVLFLAVGSALPRPHSETPLFGLSRADSKDRKASRNAVYKGDGSAGRGEGSGGEKTEAGDGDKSGKGGKDGGQSGNKQSGGGKGDQQGGKSGGDKGKQGGKGSDSGKGQDGKSGSGQKQDGKSDDGGQGDKSDGRQNSSDPGKQSGKQQATSKQNSKDQKQNDAQSGDQAKDADGEADGGDRSSDSSSSSDSSITQALEKISTGVKWLVWILVAVAVVVGLLAFVLKFLAPFTNWARGLLDWLRGLWESLFGRKPRTGAGREAEEEAEAGPQRPPPFAAFTNPFADGSARHRNMEELVEYTFAAFDSWAWDRDRGRQPDETPNELADRVGRDFPALGESGRKVAGLYVRVLYSQTPLPADTAKALRAFWERVEQGVEEEVGV